MPQVLDSYEFRESTIGHSNYDWDSLLDGKIYQLKEGEDFTCKINTFTMLVRKHANKRNLKIRVSKDEAAGTVVIQVTGQKPAKQEAEAAQPAPVAAKPSTPAPAAKPASTPPKPAPTAQKPAAPAAKPTAKSK